MGEGEWTNNPSPFPFFLHMQDHMDLGKVEESMLKKQPTYTHKDFVGFGSTCLNLAVTGHPRRGIKKGTCVLMAGDSNSGKTWITMSILAEASINPKFDDYRLIFNAPENGALMDIPTYFGRKLASRIEMRTPEQGNCPRTAEEFYDQLQTDIDDTPFIQILDSMDALSSDDDEEQIVKEKKARDAGKDVGGSYGTAKAKINSARLRTATNDIGKQGSIMVVISQLRDTIGYGAMFNPKYRAGGKALKYFSHTEIWLANRKNIEKKFNGIDVQVGGWTMAKCVRSRHTGRKREVNIPILHESGIDDVWGQIQFLIDWGHWKANAGKFTADEFGFKGTVEKLCQKIDPDDELRKQLTKVTWEYWKKIEEETSIKRRNKYAD